MKSIKVLSSSEIFQGMDLPSCGERWLVVDEDWCIASRHFDQEHAERAAKRLIEVLYREEQAESEAKRKRLNGFQSTLPA